MNKGKHLLIDCRNVRRETCLDDRRVLAALARAAENAGATVISQVRYRFGSESPPGFAAVVLLDESHCSVHTYADLGLMALDVFTCGNTNPLDVLEFLRAEIDIGDVTVRQVERFGSTVLPPEHEPAVPVEAFVGEFAPGEGAPT